MLKRHCIRLIVSAFVFVICAWPSLTLATWSKSVATPWFQQQNNPPAWYGCGAATAKMIVESTPVNGVVRTLAQYRTDIENHLAEPASWCTDPPAEEWVIEEYDIRDEPPPHNRWYIDARTDYYKAVGKLAYTLDRYGAPCATLVGAGGHWVAVVGIETSVRPTSGPPAWVTNSFVVKRVRINDPDTASAATGQNQWIWASVWENSYQTPNIYGQTYLGDMVSVLDPDPAPEEVLPYERPDPNEVAPLLSPDDAILRAQDIVQQEGLAELAVVAPIAAELVYISHTTDIGWWVGFGSGPDQISGGVLIDDDQGDPLVAGWNDQGMSIDWADRAQYWPYLGNRRPTAVKNADPSELFHVWAVPTRDIGIGRNPVGVFDDARDIGSPTGIGRTVYEGYVWKGDVLTEQYLIMGGGADIWGNWDQFHYAYKMLSGDVRLSASFQWVVASNDWAKYGVMLRDPANDGASVHYSMIDRKAQDYAGMQYREETGGNSAEIGALWRTGTWALGIQRVTVGGLPFMEGLVDFGNGWESIGAKIGWNLPRDIMAGVFITSHDDNQLVQARVWNVNYQMDPNLVGEPDFPLVPASANLGFCISDVSGFYIRSLKPLVTDGWGYDAMNELLDTGMYMGLPAQPGSEGIRVSEFVNLRDMGNGVFSIDNGYPDESFPGVDPEEIPAQDPAAGDDDDNFATEILGCIHLTAGLHIIGANSDDGTIIEIGGIEIGRTDEWKGSSNVDFLFEVEVDGYYELRARHMEGGGGASLELHEVLLDGTRILLNDVANGGSEVFTPVIPLPPPEPDSY